MSKRRISDREDLGSAKRRKTHARPSSPDASQPEIRSVEDLKRLLYFDQDSASTLHKSVAIFERYVKSIRSDLASDLSAHAILLDYLQSGSSSRGDGTPTPFAPLFQAWSFAVQTNSDQLLRAIPGALATLLATVSDQIEFRKIALQICRDILQEEPLTSIENCLKPSRHKAGVIINCLRLLSQIVAFDGGAMATKLHRHSEIYRQLESLLLMSASETEIPDKKKPYHLSIRDAAVRFLLANLRFQSRAAKAEIIGQGNIVRNLFKGVNKDPSRLLQEILTTSRTYVIDDAELFSSAKKRFLIDTTLTQVAQLYRYGQENEFDNESDSITELAHKLLYSACVPNDDEALDLDEPIVEPRPDEVARSPAKMSSPRTGLVNGRGLMVLLLKLRPHASLLQKNLTLAIFKAYPNLVHDYFKESTFQFDPKLTATWVGFSSFLLAVIMLPLPTATGVGKVLRDGDAAHTKTIRDSILPPPLHRDVLERCLNLRNEPLITFFATRLLIAAFQKLEQYLKYLAGPSEDAKNASRSILDWLCQRCPRGKLVVEAYRLLGSASSLQKEQLSRLIFYYYSIAPRLVVDAKFDASSTIVAEALGTAQSQDSAGERDELFQMQLSHLLRIALLSPSMRWWNSGSKSLTFSPFTSVLRVYVDHTPRNEQIRQLLKSILMSHAMLQSLNLDSALDVLIQSLESETTSEDSIVLFSFLDTCFFHLSKHDLKYTSMLFEAIEKLDLRRDKEIPSFSPLSIAINQQWAFAAAARPLTELADIARWIVRIFEGFDDIGESRTILRFLRDEMASKAPDKTLKKTLHGMLSDSKRLAIVQRPSEPQLVTDQSSVFRKAFATTNVIAAEEIAAIRAQLDTALAPPASSVDHPELARWRRHDISDSLEDGTVSQLLANLSSPLAEVRIQSLSGLRSIASLLSSTISSDSHTHTNSATSSSPSTTQIYLLLNEAIETVAAQPSDISVTPLPTFASALAAAILLILHSPLDIMYPKANDFLLQRPCWEVSRLPSYWLRTILEMPPSQSGMQNREIVWLLKRLAEGCASSADVELYRGNGVMERVLARCISGLASEAVREGVFGLIYRLSGYQEGATAFLTRWGGLAWLEAELAWCVKDEKERKKTAAEEEVVGATIAPGESTPFLARRKRLALLERLEETCDSERLHAWSSGKFEVMVQALRTRFSRNG